MISDEIIAIVKRKTHPFNIIMDVNQGYAHGVMPIIKACAKLALHINKFNCCYIVGDNEENFKYAVTFFQTLGASKKKAYFLKTLEEAHQDIDFHWQHYLAAKKKSNDPKLKINE